VGCRASRSCAGGKQEQDGDHGRLPRGTSRTTRLQGRAELKRLAILDAVRYLKTLMGASKKLVYVRCDVRAGQVSFKISRRGFCMPAEKWVRCRANRSCAGG
jgi:hypothetical protein